MPAPALIDAVVLPSGVGFAVQYDGFVTSVSTGDAVQTVTLSGDPSGGTFTLNDGTHTTASIPAIPSPPYRYFQWNKADLTPGTYDLSVNIFNGGTASPAVLYEIFNGTPSPGTLLGTAHLDHTLFPAGNPIPFTDGTLTIAGNLVHWFPLGRFTFTGSVLAVRVSCDGDDSQGRDRFDCDDLRIATTDGVTVVRIGPAHPPGTQVAPNFQPGNTVETWQVAGETAPAIEVDGLGSGFRYLVDPAAVQSALEALPSGGVGNFAVTGDGSPITPIRIEFTGSLGDAARPNLTASDPTNVHVLDAVDGGTLPQLIKNAGSPVPVPSSWIYWDQLGQHMPTVSIYPPVCSPAVVRQSAGQYDDGTHGRLLDNGSDGSWQIGPGGYYGQTWTTAGATPTASWYFGPWKGATYRASVSWTAAPGQSTSVTYTVKDWAGNTLGTHTVNQTLAPSGDTDQGVAWEVLGTFTVAGESAGIAVIQSNGTSAPMVANAVRLERTSPDDTFRIAPGDVVQMIWGPGWATTLDGPVPAQTTPVTLRNLAGGKLVGDPPTSHSCEIGMNLGRAASNVGTALYADFVSMTGDIADAWPTVLGGGQADFGVNATPSAYGADGKGWPNVPTGEYVLAWKGAGNCEVIGSGSPVGEHGTPVYPGTAGSQNYRYYTFGSDPTRYGTEIKVRVHGTTIIGSGPTWNTDVTDVHIYPLGTDLGSPPKYRADWLARETAIQCRRHIDPQECISGNPATYEDYNPPQSRVSKNAPARVERHSVASIATYTGSTWSAVPANSPRLLVTTADPHNFATNALFKFSDDFSAVLTLDNGSTFPLAGADGICYVESPTSFVFTADYAGAGRSMVGTITNPSGIVFAPFGCGMSLQDQVESFNASPALRTFYFNSAATASQDAITRVFDYLARNLKAGARVRHECMNETWNLGTVQRVCNAASIVFGYGGGSDIGYKCHLANIHWGWAKAAWVAAGRPAADFIRVMGSLHVSPGYTAATVDYCVANGLDFGDEVATAPYIYWCQPAYTRNPQHESFACMERMTVDQTLDQLEVYFTAGGYEEEMQAHLDQIHPHFPGVRGIYYEAGPQSLALTGRNTQRIDHAVVRDPRWKPIFEHWLSVYAASGVDAIHIYLESQIDGALWPVYNCTEQVAYVPSPEQDAIQIGTPDRMDLIQSVEGAAINDMAARFSASTTPDFSLSIAGTGSLVQGGTATRTVTLAALNGFTGSAALSVSSGLPSGVTAGFSPTSVTGGGTVTSTLTLTASGSATTGTVTLTIQGTDSADSLTHSATTSLTVTPASQPPPNSARRSRFKPMRRHRSARR